MTPGAEVCLEHRGHVSITLQGESKSRKPRQGIPFESVSWRWLEGKIRVFGSHIILLSPQNGKSEYGLAHYDRPCVPQFCASDAS